MGVSAGGGGLGWSRPLDALAHRVGTVVGVVVALVVVGWLLGPGVHDVLGLVASIVGLAWVLAQVGHGRRDHLCMPCLRAMPSDPGAAVARGRVWLRLHHRVTGSTAWAAGYVVLVVVALVPGWLQWRAVDWVWILPMAALAWLSFHHRRLRPWCPYCRGWEESGAPEPTPDPSGTKTG